MTTRTLPLSRLIPVLALAACGLVWGAAPDAGSPGAQNDYAQVQRLLREGQIARALQRADGYIAGHPNDPQMRFIKAAALQTAGRASEAEAILTQLTHDYPELAEPWNNLAVLYAARGQIDAARTALEAALRIDPGYATALENLGDIDIRLALRNYEQARQTEAGAAARLSVKIDAAQRVVGGAALPASVASSPQPAASPSEAAAPQPESAASQPDAAASQPEAAASESETASPAAEAPGPASAASSPDAAVSEPDAASPPAESAAPEPAAPEPAASEPDTPDESVAPEPADAAPSPQDPASEPDDDAAPSPTPNSNPDTP